MPISAGRVTARVIERIKSSEYLMRVYYPVARSKPTGTTVVPLPVSPLIPKPNPQPPPEDEPDRVQPYVELQCLLTETAAIGDLRRQQLEAQVGGWNREVTAMARVVASEADRVGGTVFDGCAYVEVSGQRYKVLSVVRQAASTTPLGTYYVLLTGAVKE